VKIVYPGCKMAQTNAFDLKSKETKADEVEITRIVE
jgi:hypothetical protein